MMKCIYCNGTGKYKKPNDIKKFNEFIDIEMDKAYMVNYQMAEEKAFKEIGFTIVDCPYCNNEQ